MSRSFAVAVMVCAVLGTGCDIGEMAGSVSAECTSIGARCQRPDGPIGVCQQTKCAAGVEPPCYVCTPQH